MTSGVSPINPLFHTLPRFVLIGNCGQQLVREMGKSGPGKYTERWYLRQGLKIWRMWIPSRGNSKAYRPREQYEVAYFQGQSKPVNQLHQLGKSWPKELK